MNYINPLPSTQVVNTNDLIYFLRIDPGTATQAQEVSLISGMINAATAYAEEAMSMSLVYRTITATYWHDAPQWGGVWYPGRSHRLALPRGPIVSVSSVTDNGVTLSPTNYTLQGAGNADLLYLPNGWVGPLVVTYVAGLSSDGSTVPADIVQAIRTHVGTLYEARESTTDKALTVVPHSLEAFYSRRARSTPVA